MKGMENLKIFYGETFIETATLVGSKINYPIKLEYYKINQEKKYGIEIVKKNLKNRKLEIEQERILNITTSKRKICKILEKLKRNQVMPINLSEIVKDML